MRIEEEIRKELTAMRLMKSTLEPYAKVENLRGVVAQSMIEQLKVEIKAYESILDDKHESKDYQDDKGEK